MRSLWCNYRATAAFLLIVALIGLGKWLYTDQTVTKPALQSYAGRAAELGFLVVDYPQESKYGLLVPARIGGVSAALFLSEDINCRPGDMISGRFSVAEYNHRLKAAQKGKITLTRSPEVPLLLKPTVYRRELEERLDKIFADSKLPKALLLGQKSDFSDGLSSAMSLTGLSHTVAVSGLHISFIVGIFTFIFGGKRRSAFITTPFIWLFCAVIGFPPSAVRACIMNTLVLAAPALRREYDPRAALMAAFALIVAFSPESFFDIGFQLSFASTLGIMLFANRIANAVTIKNKILRGVFSVFAVTVSAQLFTTPFTAYYFGNVSVIAPLMNLAFVWLFSLLFGLTALALAASFVYLPLGAAIAAVLGWGYTLIERAVMAVARLPFAALSVKNFIFAVFLLYFYAVIVIFLAVRKRIIVPACCVVVAFCAALIYTGAVDNTVKLIAVDTGQGQGLLVETAGGVALIDCGGSSSRSGIAVADVLMSQGRTRVDALIVSHFHADHAGGILALLDRVEVSNLIAPPECEGEEMRGEILAAAEERGVNVIVPDGDCEVQLGECLLNLYYPRDGGEINERAVAVLGEYGDFRFLTTADLGAQSERKLMHSVDLPPVDLLIAGHHGSKYSGDAYFLRQLAPQSVIICVGANNYGHPAPETLAKYEAIGAAVYRTDQNGDVTVTAKLGGAN